ncbi:4-hydroxy-tetrahydrodipicolinate reductase [Candidatus Sumerlaeota bacterium]|nr:4-hydroxy-tetrahydrodipicolinate reductase [Candidatus Sumerlaeota bacterium]
MTARQSKPIPVIISGILGRMGKTIVNSLTAESSKNKFTLVGGLERPDSPFIGKPLGEIFPNLNCKERLNFDINRINVPSAVLIEFCSSTNAVIEHCQRAAELGWGVVIGTTGLDKDAHTLLHRLAKKIPILYSPNMSMGVTILFKIADQVARILGDTYDVEIIETHHRMKKDTPSGTAQLLAEIIARRVERLTGEKAPIIYGHQPRTRTERRTGREIVIHSLRISDVVGEHTVVFAGPGERLEFTHRSSSREAFAQGTLEAVEFIYRQKPGLYDMAKVLGF